MPDEITENLKKGSTWLRLVFMFVYAIVLYLVLLILLVLVVAQALFSLLAGSANGNLCGLAASLSEYVSQMLAYMTYNSDERPFPFAPFPQHKTSSAEDAWEAASDESQNDQDANTECEQVKPGTDDSRAI